MSFHVLDKIITAKRREQERNSRTRRQQGKQDVQQGLPADGADVAPGAQQNGVHPHRFSRVAGHNVQLAPTSRVQVQPWSREHALGRWFSSVRKNPIFIVFTITAAKCSCCFSSIFTPNHFVFSAGLAGSTVAVASGLAGICVFFLLIFGFLLRSREAGRQSLFRHFGHCKFQTPSQLSFNL